MAQDAALAFTQNLVSRLMQFQQLKWQNEREDRRERRYERQLQANQRYQQQRLGLEERRITAEETRFRTTQEGVESRFARGQEFAREGQEALQGRFEAGQELTREGMEALEKRFFAGQELTREQMSELTKRFEAGQALTREGMEATRLWRQQQEARYLDDPRRAVAEFERKTLEEGTPEQRRKHFLKGTTINISAGEREKTAAGLATMDVLSNLRNLYDKPGTRTGPAVGRIDPIIGQIGLTSRDQEDFMAATSAFKNQIIKEITGAQMSETEALRIMKQVPDITDHPTRWEAKWRQSVRNIQYLLNRRQEIQGGGVPTPWVSPSESEFGPRINFPRQQPQVDFGGIDPLDLEGLFK